MSSSESTEHMPVFNWVANPPAPNYLPPVVPPPVVEPRPPGWFAVRWARLRRTRTDASAAANGSVVGGPGAVVGAPRATATSGGFLGWLGSVTILQWTVAAFIFYQLVIVDWNIHPTQIPGEIWSTVFPSPGNKLGHSFREPLANSLAAAIDAAEVANEAGQPQANIESIVQTEFMAQRDAAFQRLCTEAFNAADTQAKRKVLFTDFSRGLKRRWP